MGKILGLPVGETQEQQTASLFLAMHGVYQRQRNQTNLYLMAEAYIAWCEAEMDSQGFRKESKQYLDQVETALRSACSKYPYAKALLAQLMAFLQQLDEAERLMKEAEAESAFDEMTRQQVNRLCGSIRAKIAEAEEMNEELVEGSRKGGEEAD